MAHLSQLLSLPPQPLIALVGAGGKTTTMYTLARELAAQGQRVVTTTTTNIYSPQPDESEYVLVNHELASLLAALQDSWRHHRHVTVAREMTEEGKLKGFSAEQVTSLWQDSGAEVVIVEADGARHRKIKAPAAYEPVMPTTTNLVLVLLSAEVLHQPLSDELAHRPAILAHLTGIKLGDPLTPTVIARLLLHEQGGLKSVPSEASVSVLLTHTTQERHPAVTELARLLHAAPRIVAVYCSDRPGDWQGCVTDKNTERDVSELEDQDREE